MKPILVVQGTKNCADVPGLDSISDQAEMRYAITTEELMEALPGADAMLGWNFRADSLQKAWSQADKLRWIHWCGAGVDAAMFTELVGSDVKLTNARGIFDRPMAEWVLGVILAFAKQIPQSVKLQMNAEWKYRMSETIINKSVLIVGVGSIGRSVAKLLSVVGMNVEGVGRSARQGDADFGDIHAIDSLHERLPLADYVVLITPLTEQTRNLFGQHEFNAMASHARFINIGRGPLVVEADLLQALNSERIAGAALDVFVEEPLPADNAFWSAKNCFVSPHISGDYLEYEIAMADQFLANWKLFVDGQPLNNMIDKKLGFAASS
ncbi:MAG: phosphoglycerate dehydrogenase-like enzyme [Gammaproteobacteria bacterium]|jgi:phosphoglycerate dehydrogenase-like enzyme